MHSKVFKTSWVFFLNIVKIKRKHKTPNPFALPLYPRGGAQGTWEALYMNRIPLVSPSNDTGVYAALPVVVVEDWFAVTKEFVAQAPHLAGPLWPPLPPGKP